MDDRLREEILKYHENGKVALEVTKPLADQKMLSMAYTPGVSEVCELIKKDSSRAYDYTSKANTVAVVTDGTAVLGLGDIGPEASLPVMEGKAALFKTFADIDAWPIALKKMYFPDGRCDIRGLVENIKALSPGFGGINLEDISAPSCFDIEDILDEELDIPVFHDDQWGTAIITLAALKNYLFLSGKDISEIKVVINGAGAAGLRIADMLKADGVSECLLCDSKGIITTSRSDINKFKKRHAVNVRPGKLEDAIRGSDVFIGVSVAGCLKPEMVVEMNEFPAIFAMANPVPEILPEEVEKVLTASDHVMATGRSDYPNQINNVLGFPFIFRGALNVRATKITMNMKKAASEALADIAREKEVPEKVKRAYGRDFTFGKDYLIPTPFDPRLNEVVSRRVAQAAVNDGVAGIDKC